MAVCLQNLRIDSSGMILKVKVDRIIHRYFERTSTSQLCPIMELQSVDLIVFDASKNTRIMVRINSIELMHNHCWKLMEGTCYDIGRFLVREGGEGVHLFYHIIIMKESTITPVLDDSIPKHCFILNLVDDTNWWGNPTNDILIDACGILRSYEKSSNYKCRGIYSMSLILELEYKRKKYCIRCILQGDAFVRTLPLLENLHGRSGAFIIVQYAQINRKIDRGVELSTKLGATRVFVDLGFLKVQMAKSIVLGN